LPLVYRVGNFIPELLGILSPVLTLLDASDARIFSFAQKQGRILITRDKGFGNLSEYPLGTHNGIIVIRDPNLTAAKITRIFRQAWSQLDEHQVQGSLVIISRKKVRIRRS